MSNRDLWILLVAFPGLGWVVLSGLALICLCGDAKPALSENTPQPVWANAKDSQVFTPEQCDIDPNKLRSSVEERIETLISRNDIRKLDSDVDNAAFIKRACEIEPVAVHGFRGSVHLEIQVPCKAGKAPRRMRNDTRILRLQIGRFGDIRITRHPIFN